MNIREGREGEVGGARVVESNGMNPMKAEEEDEE